MESFESLTDSLKHEFPSYKTRGLRSSRCLTGAEEEFGEDALSEFPTVKHKTKIPYMSFRPKVQFITPATSNYHTFSQYNSLPQPQQPQMSCFIKNDNNTTNLFGYSSTKNYKAKKPQSLVPSPIKLNEVSKTSTPNNTMNEQLIVGLMKMIEKLADNQNHQAHIHKQHSCQCHMEQSRKEEVSEMKRSVMEKPHIVINNIIKGEEESKGNKHSKIYDIIDMELEKQEEVIKRLELEKYVRIREHKARYKTPDITEFDIEVDKRSRKQSQSKKQQSFSKKGKSPRQEREEVSVEMREESSNVSLVEEKQVQRRRSGGFENIRNKLKEGVPANKQYEQVSLKIPVSQAKEVKTQPTAPPVEVREAVAFDFPINNKENLSLSEAFKQKRRNFSSERPKEQRREKSKEELADIRRNMMKRKPTQSIKSESMQVTVLDSASTSAMKLSKREPSKELLDRLIHGTKSSITPKQMKALTQKNYDMLPEVVQRKEDKRKREELEARLLQKREYQKSIRRREHR